MKITILTSATIVALALGVPSPGKTKIVAGGAVPPAPGVHQNMECIMAVGLCDPGGIKCTQLRNGAQVWAGPGRPWKIGDIATCLDAI